MRLRVKPNSTCTVAEFLEKYAYKMWCSLDELWPLAVDELMLWDEPSPQHFCNLLSAYFCLQGEELAERYVFLYESNTGLKLEITVSSQLVNLVRVNHA